MGIGEADALDGGEFDGIDDQRAILPPQLVAAFAADAQDQNLFAVLLQRFDLLFGEPDDIGVEAAAQTAIGGCHDQQMRFVLAGAAEQLGRAGIVFQAARQAGDHRTHLFAIGTRRIHRLMRAAQLGSRHHLLGFCDLARRLDRSDAIAERLKAGHYAKSFAKASRIALSFGFDFRRQRPARADGIEHILMLAAHQAQKIAFEAADIVRRAACPNSRACRHRAK